MDITRYFMLNPAVAVEAYNGGQLVVRQMHHPNWGEYVQGDVLTSSYARRLWSTEWYRLFSDTVDPRSRYTWRSRFSSVLDLPGVVQYYSSGEEVLRPANEGFISSSNAIWNALTGDVKADAWSTQEKAKGSSHVAGSYVGASAGWGFNDVYEDVSVPDLFGLSDQILRKTPVFREFRNEGIFDELNGAVASHVSYAHELAYGLPALSHAAGGTPIVAFGINSVDMNLLKNYIGGGTELWPVEERGDNTWRHSDFKDLAYLYVYKVFDDIVIRADLR